MKRTGLVFAILFVFSQSVQGMSGTASMVRGWQSKAMAIGAFVGVGVLVWQAIKLHKHEVAISKSAGTNPDYGPKIDTLNEDVDSLMQRVLSLESTVFSFNSRLSDCEVRLGSIFSERVSTPADSKAPSEADMNGLEEKVLGFSHSLTNLHDRVVVLEGLRRTHTQTEDKWKKLRGQHP